MIILLLLFVGCRERADIVIVLDASNSIGVKQYFETLGYVKYLVRSINPNPSTGNFHRVAVETFSASSEVKFNLSTYQTATDMVQVMNWPFKDGATNTGAGLRTMTRVMFQPEAGDRDEVRNIGIILTDGQSSNRLNTFTGAVEAHNNNITIIAVATNSLGLSRYSRREMMGIASDPDSSNLMDTTQYDSIYDITPDIISAVCNSKSTVYLLNIEHLFAYLCSSSVPLDWVLQLASAS